MKEQADRLATEKGRIKCELQKLDERKKELNHKMKGLKAHKICLEKLLGETGRAASPTRLSKIVKKGELQTQVRPDLFKLSKYLVHGELAQKLEEAKKEFEMVRGEIEDITSRKNNVNVCPGCSGQGQLKKWHHTREDGIVHSDLDITSCSLCEGKGMIEYLNA